MLRYRTWGGKEGLRTVHIAVQRRHWRILPAIGFRRCQDARALEPAIGFRRCQGRQKVDVIECQRSMLCLNKALLLGAVDSDPRDAGCWFGP
jgi:hypothetical protein